MELVKTFSIWLECQFETSSGASWVKSGTDCHTERSRRDWRKKQATPDWQVAGLIHKRTYMPGCVEQLQDSRSPHLPTRILKVYCFQSHVLSRWSQHHTYLKAVTLGSLTWHWEDKQNAHSKDGERVRGLHMPGSSSGIIHKVTSSQWPPPTAWGWFMEKGCEQNLKNV